MKAFKLFSLSVFLIVAMMGCNSNPSDSSETEGDLTSQEQAELVATALSRNKGGIGKDIENIVHPSSEPTAAALVTLDISITMDYYDADDNPQVTYDSETTDRVDYEGIISGELRDENGFFQQLIIDNRTSFMATELLTGTAVIDGSHSNHSSYSRVPQGSGAEIHYSLECDLMAIGVAVDMEANDTFPEAGTIEGTVAGSWERITDFVEESRDLYFHFVAEYLGDNTARIELSNGDVFIVHLETDEIEEQAQE